jgi:hypothetical protein
MGTLQFAVENGQVVIRDGAYYRALSGQETMRLLNLLMEYRTEIIVRGVSDMRETERKNKERQGHKKPKMLQVDGQWVEGVEIAELEAERDE